MVLLTTSTWRMIQVDPPNTTNSQQKASIDLAIQALPQGNDTFYQAGFSTLEPELEKGMAGLVRHK